MDNIDRSNMPKGIINIYDRTTEQLKGLIQGEDSEWIRPNVRTFQKKMPPRTKAVAVDMGEVTVRDADCANNAYTSGEHYWKPCFDVVIKKKMDMRFELNGAAEFPYGEEVITIGRKWRVATGGITFKATAAWKLVSIALQPAVAATAGGLIDRNAVAAAEALNVMFPLADPKNKVSLGTDARAVVSRLSGKDIECSAYTWRLAVLYAAKAWAEKLDIDDKLVTASQPSAVDVCNVVTADDWHRNINRTQVNWVSYSTTAYTRLSADEELSVLVMAAQEQPQFVMGGCSIPSVLQTFPPIPEIKVQFCGGVASTARDCFNSLTSTQVWDVASEYCKQNGDTEMLSEFTRTIFAMLYAPDKDQVAPYFMGAVELPMPQAKMEAAYLLPISQRILAYGEKNDYVLAPDTKACIANGIIMAAMMHLSIRQVAFGFGMGVRMIRKHPALQRAGLLFVGKRGPTPIMLGARRWTNSIISDVEYGRVFIRASIPGAMTAKLFSWYDMHDSLQWEEIMPAVDKLPPNSGLFAYTSPLGIDDISTLATGDWHHVKSVPKANCSTDAIASLAKHPGIEFAIREFDVASNKWRMLQYNIDKHVNGRTNDWGLHEKVAIENIQLRIHFKFVKTADMRKAYFVDKHHASRSWYMDVSQETRPTYSMPTIDCSDQGPAMLESAFTYGAVGDGYDTEIQQRYHHDPKDHSNEGSNEYPSISLSRMYGFKPPPTPDGKGTAAGSDDGGGSVDTADDNDEDDSDDQSTIDKEQDQAITASMNMGPKHAESLMAKVASGIRGLDDINEFKADMVRFENTAELTSRTAEMGAAMVTQIAKHAPPAAARAAVTKVLGIDLSGSVNQRLLARMRGSTAAIGDGNLDRFCEVGLQWLAEHEKEPSKLIECSMADHILDLTSQTDWHNWMKCERPMARASLAKDLSGLLRKMAASIENKLTRIGVLAAANAWETRAATYMVNPAVTVGEALSEAEVVMGQKFKSDWDAYEKSLKSGGKKMAMPNKEMATSITSALKVWKEMDSATKAEFERLCLQTGKPLSHYIVAFRAGKDSNVTQKTHVEKALRELTKSSDRFLTMQAKGMQSELVAACKDWTSEGGQTVKDFIENVTSIVGIDWSPELHAALAELSVREDATMREQLEAAKKEFDALAGDIMGHTAEGQDDGNAKAGIATHGGGTTENANYIQTSNVPPPPEYLERMQDKETDGVVVDKNGLSILQANAAAKPEIERIAGTLPNITGAAASAQDFGRDLWHEPSMPAGSSTSSPGLGMEQTGIEQSVILSSGVITQAMLRQERAGGVAFRNVTNSQPNIESTRDNNAW